MIREFKNNALLIQDGRNAGIGEFLRNQPFGNGANNVV